MSACPAHFASWWTAGFLFSPKSPGGWKRDIEDYAFVTLRTPSGMVFLNEASYTFLTTGSDSERKIAGVTLTFDSYRLAGETL
jgi:hypothetical protein